MTSWVTTEDEIWCELPRKKDLTYQLDRDIIVFAVDGRAAQNAERFHLKDPHNNWSLKTEQRAHTFHYKLYVL